EPRVGDERGLDDLGEAARELARGERPERGRVGEDEARLMERPDEVLPGVVVDAGLAADSAVRLRDEARREVGEGEAAQQRRRREPREVTDDPAAEREHGRLPADSEPERP